jgi:hypothetical protein
VGNNIPVEDALDVFLSEASLIKDLPGSTKRRLRTMLYLMPAEMVIYMVYEDSGFLAWALSWYKKQVELGYPDGLGLDLVKAAFLEGFQVGCDWMY